MVYRVPPAAPESQVAPDRRGRPMGHYCLVCASLYPLHGGTHTGRPVYGRDHIASPCSHEGDVFEAGAAWWEPGVEVLPPSAAAGGAAPAPAASQPAGAAVSQPAAGGTASSPAALGPAATGGAAAAAATVSQPAAPAASPGGGPPPTAAKA